MSITITVGKTGRIVVPKEIRDNLSLHEGSRLKLEIQGGKLQAAPVPDPELLHSNVHCWAFDVRCSPPPVTRHPEGTFRALLRVAESHPQAVLEALHR